MSEVIRGFNGDSFIKGELVKLVEKFGVKTIVETGTFHGGTTMEFCKIVNKVFTIEINETYYKGAVEVFSKNKLPITAVKGTSPVEMEKIIKGIYTKIEKPILFYLDAHWHKYNPLLDELAVISKFKLNNSLIAIHDFKVPGKNFGFDKFSDGTEYTFEFIKKHVERIYGLDGYSYHYNEQADGANRGIIFIYPKQ